MAEKLEDLGILQIKDGQIQDFDFDRSKLISSFDFILGNQFGSFLIF